jgi:hypothetical protein
MDEQHRLTIVKNLKSVDIALIAFDQDGSIADTLDHVSNHNENGYYEFIFFNSGDRIAGYENKAEIEICNKKHIKREFIDLPKICSSSSLKANLSS